MDTTIMSNIPTQACEAAKICQWLSRNVLQEGMGVSWWGPGRTHIMFCLHIKRTLCLGKTIVRCWITCSSENVVLFRQKAIWCEVATWWSYGTPSQNVHPKETYWQKSCSYCHEDVPYGMRSYPISSVISIDFIVIGENTISSLIQWDTLHHIFITFFSVNLQTPLL